MHDNNVISAGLSGKVMIPDDGEELDL